MGTISCASSLCHGSVSPWNGSAVMQNEYVIWSRLDKHARAYSVLLNEKSRRMASNLALPQPAHQSKICLDCHAHNPSGAPADARHKVSDGVSCEACHGPSERWLSGHVASDASPASNLSQGMFPSHQPEARAKLCLSCHYGSTDKYVSHRLMAAGHPRLSFEVETFTSLQPAHFKVDADYTARKGVVDGAKVWAIGQAVAVATQMQILLDPERGRDGVFPELTLFDCHSCHHNMADNRWRPTTGFGQSISPGLIRLNDSSMLMLRLILRQVDPALGERFSRSVAQLNSAVAGKGKLTESANDVLASAQAASKKIASSAFSTEAIRTLALNLVDDGLLGNYADYAGAEQAALALGSLVNTMNQAGQLKSAALVNKALARLRQDLQKDEAYKPSDFQNRLREFRLLIATR